VRRSPPPHRDAPRDWELKVSRRSWPNKRQSFGSSMSKCEQLESGRVEVMVSRRELCWSRDHSDRIMFKSTDSHPVLTYDDLLLIDKLRIRTQNARNMSLSAVHAIVVAIAFRPREISNNRYPAWDGPLRYRCSTSRLTRHGVARRLTL
jgi:hypothetical protein